MFAGACGEAYRFLADIVVNAYCTGQNDEAPLAKIEVPLDLEDSPWVGVKRRIALEPLELRRIYTRLGPPAPRWRDSLFRRNI